MANIHFIIYGCAILLCIKGTLSKGAVDLQLHDTYFVIARGHLLWFAAIVYALMGLLYQISGEWSGISRSIAQCNTGLIVGTTMLLLFALRTTEPSSIREYVPMAANRSTLLIMLLITSVTIITHIGFIILSLWKIAKA